ncbi:MAG: tRNA lysidine(34) synthetase TilS [Phycisphaerae bacterium]
MPRPTGLIQQLDQQLHKSRLFRKREHLLIACSGGADSVALTHLLAHVSRSNHWRWTLRLVHINHRTRPEENELDAALVRQLAAELHIPLTVATLRPSRHTRSENELRQLRWQKFQAVAARYRCTCVVTAHHADDQAETVLLRLMRGAGTRGLGAMALVRRAGSLRVVRPLLKIEKRRLLNYLHEHHLNWREDSSNSDLRHLRNQIRTRILPAIAACQPQIASILATTALQMRRIDRFIGRQVKQLTAELGIRTLSKPTRSLRREILRSADPAVLTAFIRRWLIAQGVAADRLSFNKLDDIRRRIMRQKSGLIIELEGDKTVRIERDVVRFIPASRRIRLKGLQ